MPSGKARELMWCTGGAVALAVLQWWPALRTPASTGFGDWQMIHHNWEAAYVTISRFGQWPLWDAFHCGGVPILGNPESQVYAPWFWLSFVFGTVMAVKLMLLGHIACAAVGMYWLTRRHYQLHPAAAAVAAIAWSCGGCFVWDGAGGHATFLSFAFAPWLSYFIQRGVSLRRDAAAVGALLVLSLLEGGTYPLPYFMIWTTFELCVRALRPKMGARAVWNSVRFAALSLSLLAVCGAIRFVPIYLTLQAHPRKVPNTDALRLADVWTMLTARSHAWEMPGHPFVWPEYDSYLGVPVVIFALLGLPLALRSGRRHLLVALGLYAALMFGNLGPLAPYSLLHHLPIYDSLRVPSRFSMFVTFYVAVLAAHAIDAGLCALQRPRLAFVLGAMVAAGVSGDLLSASWPIVSLWRQPPLSNAKPSPEFHLVARDYYAAYASYPRLNLGTPACYIGGMNWPVSGALWVGATPQVRVPKAAGRVEQWTWSPNRLDAAFVLRAPATAVFNENFARGFVSSLGVPRAKNGLLALNLPAGKHTVTLRYRPPELIVSAAVSGAGALLLLGLLVWPPRRSEL